MSPFVFNCFHWAEWFGNPPVLLSVLLFHSYVAYSIVWLSCNLFNHSPIDWHLDCHYFWQLWTMIKWIFAYVCLFECMSSFLSGKYPGQSKFWEHKAFWVWESRELPFCHPPVCPISSPWPWRFISKACILAICLAQLLNVILFHTEPSPLL